MANPYACPLVPDMRCACKGKVESTATECSFPQCTLGSTASVKILPLSFGIRGRLPASLSSKQLWSVYIQRRCWKRWNQNNVTEHGILDNRKRKKGGDTEMHQPITHRGENGKFQTDTGGGASQASSIFGYKAFCWSGPQGLLLAAMQQQHLSCSTCRGRVTTRDR